MLVWSAAGSLASLASGHASDMFLPVSWDPLYVSTVLVKMYLLLTCYDINFLFFLVNRAMISSLEFNKFTMLTSPRSVAKSKGVFPASWSISHAQHDEVRIVTALGSRNLHFSLQDPHGHI